MTGINLYWCVLPLCLIAVVMARLANSRGYIVGSALLFLVVLFLAVVVSLGDLDIYKL